MEMYNSACKETLAAKGKAREIDEWKLDEARRIEGCRQTREFAMIMVETEKHKCKAAIEAAQMAQRLAELESQKRKEAEMKLLQEAEKKKKAMDALAHCDIRYRKYSIEEIETATGYFSPSEKIGEGGYGPVYKAYLDHTAVAIKVLRSDISQGKKQFQREVLHFFIFLASNFQTEQIHRKAHLKISINVFIICRNGNFTRYLSHSLSLFVDQNIFTCTITCISHSPRLQNTWGPKSMKTVYFMVKHRKYYFE